MTQPVTFGLVSDGNQPLAGSAAKWDGQWTCYGNYWNLARVRVPVDTLVTSLGWKPAATSGTIHWKLAVYADGPAGTDSPIGQPLLGYTAVSTGTTSGAYAEANVLTPFTIPAGTTVWVGINTDNGGGSQAFGWGPIGGRSYWCADNFATSPLATCSNVDVALRAQSYGAYLRGTTGDNQLFTVLWDSYANISGSLPDVGSLGLIHITSQANAGLDRAAIYWNANHASAKWKAALYASSGGASPSPTTLLWVGPEKVGVVVGWNTLDLTGMPALSMSTDYWLGVTSDTDLPTNGVARGSGVNPAYYRTPHYSTYGASLPNPWGEDLTGASSGMVPMFSYVQTSEVPQDTRSTNATLATLYQEGIGVRSTQAAASVLYSEGVEARTTEQALKALYSEGVAVRNTQVFAKVLWSHPLRIRRKGASVRFSIAPSLDGKLEIAVPNPWL